MHRVCFSFSRKHCDDPCHGTRRAISSANIAMINTKIRVEPFFSQHCDETYCNMRWACLRTSTLKRVLKVLNTQTVWPLDRNDVIVKLWPRRWRGSREYLRQHCTTFTRWRSLERHSSAQRTQPLKRRPTASLPIFHYGGLPQTFLTCWWQPASRTSKIFDLPDTAPSATTTSRSYPPAPPTQCNLRGEATAWYLEVQKGSYLSIPWQTIVFTERRLQ